MKLDSSVDCLYNISLDNSLYINRNGGSNVAVNYILLKHSMCCQAQQPAEFSHGCALHPARASTESLKHLTTNLSIGKCFTKTYFHVCERVVLFTSGFGQGLEKVISLVVNM